MGLTCWLALSNNMGLLNEKSKLFQATLLPENAFWCSCQYGMSSLTQEVSDLKTNFKNQKFSVSNEFLNFLNSPYSKGVREITSLVWKHSSRTQWTLRNWKFSCAWSKPEKAALHLFKGWKWLSCLIGFACSPTVTTPVLATHADCAMVGRCCPVSSSPNSPVPREELCQGRPAELQHLTTGTEKQGTL